jgi:hypothetical protein
MKIISFIEREELIKKILKHLGLWEVKSVSTELAEVRPPPKIHSPPAELYADYSLAELGQALPDHPLSIFSQMTYKT